MDIQNDTTLLNNDVDSQDIQDGQDEQNTQQNTTGLETIFGEYANEPSIQKFKNPQDLAKSYLELQKVVGKKRIIYPEKPEEFDEVLKELGKPESPDKYPDFEDAESVFGSKDEFNEFKKVAYESGLLPKQFETLYNKIKEININSQQQDMEYKKQMVEQSLKKLQSEWGNDIENKLNIAKKVFNIMPKDLQQKIQQIGLDADAEFVKFLSNIGEYYKEDSFNVGSYSVSDAKSELQSILNDKNNPYFDRQHPEHKAAVEKVQKLYKIIYG